MIHGPAIRSNTDKLLHRVMVLWSPSHPNWRDHVWSHELGRVGGYDTITRCNNLSEFDQIAGDLLPDATKETILATAFFRNHKYTEEGGVIPEEYRMEYLIDKTKTFRWFVQFLSIKRKIILRRNYKINFIMGIRVKLARVRIQI